MNIVVWTLNCLIERDGWNPLTEIRMSFGIYMIGFIILIIGIALGFYLIHMPPAWIGVGVIILAGLGILLGVTSTRRRDSQ